MTGFDFEVIDFAKEKCIFPEVDRLFPPQNESYRRFINVELANIWCAFFPICVEDRGKVIIRDYKAVLDSGESLNPRATVDIELVLQPKDAHSVSAVVHLTLPAPTADGSFYVNGIELAFPAMLTDDYTNDLRILKVKWLDSALGGCVKKALEGYVSALAERMKYGTLSELTEDELIDMLPVQDVIDDFFGNSPLLQRIDSTNPLARMAQLRRIRRIQDGSEKPKTISGTERYLHPTSYGRFDYLDTPEGPNVGLIHSLCVFAGVDENDEVTTPYGVMEDGKSTGDTVFLTASADFGKAKAPWNYRCDDTGERRQLWVRIDGTFRKADPGDVQLQEVSPVQGLGISSCLVPFLGSDDANRAGLGVNMMRQAVPILGKEIPWVMSGAERLAAKWTGADERFTVRGCLTLGTNVLAAFLPWDGYNYEDAIVVSDAFVERDALTSIADGGMRKLSVGDKLATRHGAKGVVSKIIPAEEMPRLPDSRPVEMLLNPMGLISRMNFGQILEASAGLAAWKLGKPVVSPPYCGATLKDIRGLLRQADLPETGMFELTDPRSGKVLNNPVTVGMQYVFKLNQMVEDKLVCHRQRIGTMEIMAMVVSGAYGNVNEALKSDTRASAVSNSFKELIEAARCGLIDIKTIDNDGRDDEER